MRQREQELRQGAGRALSLVSGRGEVGRQLQLRVVREMGLPDQAAALLACAPPTRGAAPVQGERPSGGQGPRHRREGPRPAPAAAGAPLPALRVLAPLPGPAAAAPPGQEGPPAGRAAGREQPAEQAHPGHRHGDGQPGTPGLGRVGQGRLRLGRPLARPHARLTNPGEECPALQREDAPARPTVCRPGSSHTARKKNACSVRDVTVPGARASPAGASIVSQKAVPQFPLEDVLNASRRRQSRPRRCPSSVRGSGRRPFRRGLLSSLVAHGNFRESGRRDYDDARVCSYFLPRLLHPTDSTTLRLFQRRLSPLRDHFPCTGGTGRQTHRSETPSGHKARPTVCRRGSPHLPRERDVCGVCDAVVRSTRAL
ncbi:unnamed protein product [Ixodes pacificus]